MPLGKYIHWDAVFTSDEADPWHVDTTEKDIQRQHGLSCIKSNLKKKTALSLDSELKEYGLTKRDVREMNATELAGLLGIELDHAKSLKYAVCEKTKSQSWTPEEDETLVQSESISEAESKLNRSYRSIAQRLHKLKIA